MRNLKEAVEYFEANTDKFAKKDPEAVEILRYLLRELLSEEFDAKCGDCVSKAYWKVRKSLHLRNHNNEIMEQEFKFKKDKSVLIGFGTGQVINHMNCTDEMAIKFLKANPKRISYFDKFPKNWQEIVEGKAVRKEVVEAEEVETAVQSNEAEIAEVPPIQVAPKKQPFKGSKKRRK